MRSIVRSATLLLLLALLPLGLAEVPSLVSLSGRLTTSDGSALAGPANLSFALYNDSTSGAALWSETHNGVALSNGVFSVLLGSITPLNLSFSESYWIAMTVNGELQNPRLRLAAAPYAIAANRSQNATFADEAGRSANASWANNSTWTQNATFADEAGRSANASWANNSTWTQNATFAHRSGEASLARDLECTGCVGSGELAAGFAGPDVFGDGSDGDATVSATTTLTRDMFYNNLTVNAGVTLNTGGYQIFVSGTLTLNGTIANNGGSGSTPGGGAGAPGGTLGRGGNGGSGGANGGSGNPGESGTIGGAGGNGGNGQAGGSVNFAPHRKKLFLPNVYLQLDNTLLGGAGGGGGNALQGTAYAGGGGGGGGVIFIAARHIVGSGAIQAKGGRGGDAALSLNDAGGGGGGGGGVVIIVYSTGVESITFDVSGGTGGAGRGAASGQPGSPGNVWKWRV